VDKLVARICARPNPDYGTARGQPLDRIYRCLYFFCGHPFLANYLYGCLTTSTCSVCITCLATWTNTTALARVLHRYYSTPKSQDAFHHQRQIILCNSGSADSSLIELIQLHFAWHRRGRILWLFPTVSTALFCIIAFTLAGGFSSQISSSAGTEAVLDGINCGQPNLGNVSLAALDSWVANQVNNGLNYVQQCYSANSSGLIDCKSFVKERIPSYINNTAPCPFANELCRSNSSNLILDTGYLNSHYDFGINAPPDQRILLRRVLQCAPLTTTGRATDYQDEKFGNRTRYSYGDANFGSSNATLAKNYTYIAESLNSQCFPDKTSDMDYRLGLHSSPPGVRPRRIHLRSSLALSPLQNRLTWP
jgi:hypothetical protein